jgi:esterase/lipase
LKSRILEAYLSDDEDSAVLKSQIVISKLGDGRGGTRKLPYAFTEQGVSMLSSVLRSETAIQVNIAIMRVFVAARQAIAKPQQRSIEERMKSLEDTLEEIVADQNDINEDTRMQLELINEVLAQLQAEAPKREHKETGYLAVKKEQNQ